MSHQDFRPMSDAEFRERFAPPESTPSEPAPKDTPLKRANDIARQAASLAYRIACNQPDPMKWKPLIDAAPEELRECLTEYMRQRWRTLKQRERLAQDKGKHTASGDAFFAEHSGRFGRVG